MDNVKTAYKTEIIPYIIYRDVPAALAWLADVFGFIEELRHPTPAGMHAQMTFNGQRIMMGQGGEGWRILSPMHLDTKMSTMGIFIYLTAVDAHYQHALKAGAEIVQAPHDESYGRTYFARDIDGHPWFFTTPPI